MLAINRLRLDADEYHQLVVMMCWIAAIHFVIEALIMGTFSNWNLTSEVVWDGLLDSTSLTVLSSPAIYYFVARPFIISARDAKRALNAELEARERQSQRLQSTLDDLKHTLSINEELRARLQSASGRVAEVSEKTLQRIGADLHDGPAQLLAYTLLRLGKLAPQVEGAPGGRTPADLEQIRTALSDTLAEVRSISRGLSLPRLGPGNTLQETVEMVVDIHQEQTGTRVELALGEIPAEVPQQLKTCVCRVVQESLSNAYKHANAKQQKVAVFMDKELVLQISDKGPGFDPEDETEGFGLAGMRARVEAHGGTLSVVTGSGKGTTVTARLDLQTLAS